MVFLRQSTESQVVPFGVELDDTDGKTPETALTIANTDLKIWKRNATSGVSKNSGGATHSATGNWYCTFDATDTDTLGSGRMVIQISGALPCIVHFTVLPQMIFDSLILGTDYLQSDVQQWKGATAQENTGDAYARLGTPSGASIAADIQTRATLTDIINGVLNELLSGHSTSGSVAKAISDIVSSGAKTDTLMNLNSAYDSAKAVPTLSAIVNGVLNELISSHSTSGSVAKAISDILSTGAKTDSAMALSSAYDSAKEVPTLASIINGVLNELLSAHTTSGSLSKAIADILANGAKTDTLMNLDASYDTAKTALQAGSLATLESASSAIQTTTDKVSSLIEADGSDFRFKANTLELAPTGSGGTATVDLSSITTVTDILGTLVEADGTEYRFKTKTLELSPSGIEDGSIRVSYGPILDENGFPISNCEAFISTDVNGLNRIRTKITNDSGMVVFWLDAGTYYVWAVDDRFSFNSAPEVLVVEEPA